MYLNFSIYAVFLKNRSIIFKMKISKVTDYAALNQSQQFSRYIKVALYGISLPIPIWDIFGEVVYNCYRKVQLC